MADETPESGPDPALLDRRVLDSAPLDDRVLGSALVEGRVVPLHEARVPVTDRGFLFADSVFETVRTYGARPFLLGDHLDRLRISAAELSLPLPWSDAALSDGVARVVAARGFPGQSAVRIVVTRGDGGSGLAFPDPQRPRLVLLCRPAPPTDSSWLRDGIALIRPTRHTTRDAGGLGHVKSGAYLGNVLALRESAGRGGFEALLRGSDGSWGEATTSNLFAVKGGAVLTPGVEVGILPGITRSVVLCLAEALELSTTFCPLSDGALEGADELFVTSSLKELLPATRLDGEPVGDGRPGPVTLRLRAAFDALVADVMAGSVVRLADVPHPRA